jgi:ABC-type Na+ efflux pump permease subunit
MLWTVSAACIIVGWLAVAIAALAFFQALMTPHSSETYNPMGAVGLVAQLGFALVFGAIGLMLVVIGEATRVFVRIEYNTAHTATILQTLSPVTRDVLGVNPSASVQAPSQDAAVEA